MIGYDPGDEIPPVAYALERLDDAALILDAVADLVRAHRHTVDDPVVAEAYVVAEDQLARGWAALKRARTILAEPPTPSERGWHDVPLELEP